MKNRILLILLAVMLTLSVGLTGCGGERVPEVMEYSLTISSTEGGKVTTPGDGIFSHNEGMVVPLVALPHSGYRFVNWTGDVDTVTNVDDSSTTVTVNDDYSITAKFIKQYDLTISSTTGGSVTTPGEATYTYDEGEVINLVAEADESYDFAEWTGDVGGIANTDAASTTITMDGDFVITANFGPPTYESLDYFPITEGRGIKYHVTDNYYDTPCNVNIWAVSQYFETGKPNDLDFVFTLVKEGAGGEYYCPNCLGGQASFHWDGKHHTAFYAGCPSGNQGNFYGDFCVLRTFSSGNEWSWAGRQYMVEWVGQQKVNEFDFADCIKITVDSSSRDDVYMRGSGYFILARDVGIVELVFNRTDGTRVLYEYVEHRQLVRYTISGSIHDNGIPVEKLLVNISVCNWGMGSVTDSNGAFSIQGYGPDIVLRFGYDEDNDDVLDFDDYPDYPKEYSVNNIASDIVDSSINMSTL